MVARNEQRIEELGQELQQQYGTSVLTLPLDVTDAQAVADQLQGIEKRFGIPDILINNAGVNCTVPALDVDMVDARQAGLWVGTPLYFRGYEFTEPSKARDMVMDGFTAPA